MVAVVALAFLRLERMNQPKIPNAATAPPAAAIPIPAFAPVLRAEAGGADVSESAEEVEDGGAVEVPEWLVVIDADFDVWEIDVTVEEAAWVKPRPCVVGIPLVLVKKI